MNTYLDILPLYKDKDGKCHYDSLLIVINNLL